MAIGVYFGMSKPENAMEYLKLFADNVDLVLENGIIINNNKLSVQIRSCICDTPARAFIKGNQSNVITKILTLSVTSLHSSIRELQNLFCNLVFLMNFLR